MARTSVLPTDPIAKKAWDSKVTVSATKDGFWSGKMTGTEEQNLPGVIKVDLEKKKSGDQLTINLAGKLQGGPVYGSEKAEGTEERITLYTDQIKIDKLRKFVNAGDIMVEKRTAFSMLSLASTRLSDFAAEFFDEAHFAYASGTAGVADNMLYIPQGWTGMSGNALEAPDSNHTMYGGVATSKATLQSTDLMSLRTVDFALSRAKKMIGAPGRSHRMQPVRIGDGQAKHFCLVMSIEQANDIRQAIGDASWLAIAKALAMYEGRKSPIIQGGLGMHNSVILMEHVNVVNFSDYGAGANVPAQRGLFLGAHALGICFGSSGESGMRMQMIEDDVDHHEENVLGFRSMVGIKKTRYNSMDFGIISVDTAYTAIANSLL